MWSEQNINRSDVFLMEYDNMMRCIVEAPIEWILDVENPFRESWTSIFCWIIEIYCILCIHTNIQHGIILLIKYSWKCHGILLELWHPLTIEINSEKLNVYRHSHLYRLGHFRWVQMETKSFLEYSRRKSRKGVMCSILMSFIMF